LREVHILVGFTATIETDWIYQSFGHMTNLRRLILTFNAINNPIYLLKSEFLLFISKLSSFHLNLFNAEYEQTIESFFALSKKVPTTVKLSLGNGLHVWNPPFELSNRIKKCLRMSMDHPKFDCLIIFIKNDYSEYFSEAEEEKVKILITEGFSKVKECEEFKTISVPFFTKAEPDSAEKITTLLFSCKKLGASCKFHVRLRYYNLIFTNGNEWW
jgi:hypothetical protein